MNKVYTLRGNRAPGGQQRRGRLGPAAAILALAALFVAACGPSTAAPVAVAPTLSTAVPATQEAATATGQPSALPATAASRPTAVPATQTPTVAQIEPSVTSAPVAPTSLPNAGGQATAVVSPTTGAPEGEVDLEDFQFQPQVLTVKVGTTVKWSNKDNVQHTVTSDTNVFDSGSLAKGEDFFFTFTKAGEYPYYCQPHGGPNGVGMSGKIVVVP